MKFWQKIFIYSVVIFLIIFNLGAYILIENSHNLNLKRSINRGLEEHSRISTGISFNINLIKKYSEVYPGKYYQDYYSENNNVNKKVIKEYLGKFNDDIYLEVVNQDNETVFTNLDFKVLGERQELKDPFLDKRKYIIRDIGDKTFLFINSLLDTKGEVLKFSYIKDITYIYQDRKAQYNLFIKLCSMLSIILAIFMYVLTKHVTSPINKLINVTKLISNGDYSKRAEIKSKDEIGALSENFNSMALSIEEKITELDKKAEERQRFIESLTHEIKTPLTSIIGYSDFLRSTAYDEKVFLKGLNYIFKEGTRLEELSWKMMDLILLKRENFKMVYENINTIAEDIKESLQNRLKIKNINLIIDIKKEYFILVEKDLIRNLIINLIDNSIKASKERSNIYLNVYKNENSKIIIEIIDEGIGISKEDLPKVFEAFYMVDKSRTRANNGAGLGLAICAEIAEIHEAKLEIKSEINKGTLIKLILNQKEQML
ncbi:HAMP domain-containing sensor histidine kinase [Clostridium oceanicum]|uniref:histidine kinase n=1 Tax=Clostridium oceanicum TaxID=1543 RepID=A0ABP3UQT7_9CLOT